MKRDNFTCQHCGATDKTLQVHHLCYQKGNNPWEYDNSELLTLCCDCHEFESECAKELYENFKNLKEMWQLAGFSICMLNGFLTVLSNQFEDIYGRREKGEKVNVLHKWVKDIIYQGLWWSYSKQDAIRAIEYGVECKDVLEHNDALNCTINETKNE